MLAVAVATLAGGACAHRADGPDATTGAQVGEFAATSEYLAGVADATEGLSYRMSMDMTMSMSGAGDSIEMGGPVMTGEVDGERSSIVMDMGELFADLPGAGMPVGDLTMEIVTDGIDSLYVRAPFFATIAQEALDAGATRSDLGPLADLAELDTTWGRVDLSEMSPTKVASTVGSQTTDPQVFLDMLARGTDVSDLGTDTIDGVQVRGLAATVLYEDMIEAQDLDLDEVRDQFDSAMPGGAEPDAVIDAVLDLELPLEVWVDDDDRVRRITMALDMGALFEQFEDAGAGGMQMSTDISIDFADYGDDSIAVEVPADAVDVTDSFLALEQGGGLGTSPIGSS